MKDGFVFVKRMTAEIIVILIALTVFFGGIVCMNFVQETFLIAENFDLWIMMSPWDRGIFILEIFFVFYAIDFIWRSRIKYADEEEHEIQKNISDFFRKHRKKRITVIGAVFYVVFINVAWIKGDGIFIRKILNPFGREYSIDDIEEVKTGFYHDYIPLAHNKGEFYYVITLKDGRKINLNNFSGEGKQYEMDTYLAIEEIDKRIMDKGNDIIKVSSLDNIEYTLLDDYYIERFKRIIDNK